MTKTFSPFFSPPAPVEPEDPDDDEDVELLEELLHAASTEHATSSTAGPKKARLRERLMTESFQLRGEKTNTGWPDGCGPHAGGDRTPGGGAHPGPGRAREPASQSWLTPEVGLPALSSARARARTGAAFGTKTLTSSRPPMTMPMASWLKLVSSSAPCRPARASTASTTPPIEPLPPKMDTPPSRTIATTFSSAPRPLFCTAVARRNVHSTPASAQTRPEVMNSMVLMRLTRIPANSAASVPAPIA